MILWHVYFGDVWLISAATVDESYICMLFEFWCEDVASISWIYALFACIIALIEIGRYSVRLEQSRGGDMSFNYVKSCLMLLISMYFTWGQAKIQVWGSLMSH